MDKYRVVRAELDNSRIRLEFGDGMEYELQVCRVRRNEGPDKVAGPFGPADVDDFFSFLSRMQMQLPDPTVGEKGSDNA